MAFICTDIDQVRMILDDMNVFYKTDEPVSGIRQIFLFDPDGNVIEISNCAPPTGFISCINKLSEEAPNKQTKITTDYDHSLQIAADPTQSRLLKLIIILKLLIKVLFP